tara:strand:+ start:75 stop:599 length:525 start_codon:yes stop_codon:yes gene_type:complete
MNNKWVYIVLFALLCAKPITDVMNTHDNGLPKVINTYDLKKDGLKLKEQQFFYSDGTLKAKGVLKRDVWEWSYYSNDGKKILEPIALDDSNNNFNNIAITEIQNNQQIIVKQIQALAKEQQNLRKTLTGNNSKTKKQDRPQADPNKVYDIPIGDSIVIGNPNAKVTIIEWTDFQ